MKGSRDNFGVPDNQIISDEYNKIIKAAIWNLRVFQVCR